MYYSQRTVYTFQWVDLEVYKAYSMRIILLSVTQKLLIELYVENGEYNILKFFKNILKKYLCSELRLCTCRQLVSSISVTKWRKLRSFLPPSLPPFFSQIFIERVSLFQAQRTRSRSRGTRKSTLMEPGSSEEDGH